MVVALAALSLPTAARAHLVSTGVGPFYDGGAHFFVSFEEVLPVLGLALLAGLGGPRFARWTIAILPAAWLLGALAGVAPRVSLEHPVTVALLLLVPGTLVAADPKLPLAAIAVAAAAIGATAGLINGAAMAESSAGALGVLGASSAAFVVATLTGAAAIRIGAGQARVALRVAGSWLAAVGLLALGWALRGN